MDAHTHKANLIRAAGGAELAPASTRAAAPVTSPVDAAETKSVPVPVHYQVQHAAPRVDDVSVVLPWRPRVLRPCDMEYVMLHLIFSLPHA